MTYNVFGGTLNPTLLTTTTNTTHKIVSYCDTVNSRLARCDDDDDYNN